MPFNLKLKKSRHYNVVSKTLFVICIELLDGSNIECTLSSESVGRDCLNHVCQRLLINQPHFFGLRFISRDGSPLWIDLERPLKRQLNKQAISQTLYLRVMYYVVSGVSLITDEGTRYHYFLQVKNDVIEDRITCDFEQAVRLASYSRQAEYGNHDTERHTVGYLKKLLSYPRHLVEAGHLEALTEAVIYQHAAVQNMSQRAAEEYYIEASQSLEGYGVESFTCKDERHCKISLGVCISGITVSRDQEVEWYKWKDISNIINHRRSFTIESPPHVGRPVVFQFADVDAAKYIWRLCVLQHTFYMRYVTSCEKIEPPRESIPLLQESIQERESPMTGISVRDFDNVQSPSCIDIAAATNVNLRSLLPTYRPAPDYETAMQQKQRSSMPELMPHSLYGSRLHFTTDRTAPDLNQNGTCPTSDLSFRHLDGSFDY